MLSRSLICVVLSLSTCFAADTPSKIDALPPYPLPGEVAASITDLAAESRVLILGEIHGTQEVPALAASLLPRLTELGYHVLALEVPSDHVVPLNEWASGNTDVIPPFFAAPSGDGRGNVQLLSLIRTALSQPYRWQLICFDMAESDFLEQFEKQDDTAKEQPEKVPSSPPDSNAAMLKISLKRDASMAAKLAAQYKNLGTDSKVMVICGGLHARTKNTSKQQWIKELWPSFASLLRDDKPEWKIGTINIRPRSGSFFNNDKINKLNGPKLEKAEAHATPEADYSWELNLPEATPATFLATPKSFP